MSPDTFLRVPRAEAGADCVCAAFAEAGGWTVWGEPESAVSAYAAAGDSEAATGADSGDVSRVAGGDRIDLKEHDIKFEEDNWEWPVGRRVGRRVAGDDGMGRRLRSLRTSSSAVGMDLDPISGEITYGLERMAQFLQDKESIYDIVWAVEPDTGRKVTYGEMRLWEEAQFFGLQLRLRGCGEALGPFESV